MYFMIFNVINVYAQYELMPEYIFIYVCMYLYVVIHMKNTFGKYYEPMFVSYIN